MAVEVARTPTGAPIVELQVVVAPEKTLETEIVAVVAKADFSDDVAKSVSHELYRFSHHFGRNASDVIELPEISFYTTERGLIVYAKFNDHQYGTLDKIWIVKDSSLKVYSDSISWD